MMDPDLLRQMGGIMEEENFRIPIRGSEPIVKRGPDMRCWYQRTRSFMNR